MSAFRRRPIFKFFFAGRLQRARGELASFPQIHLTTVPFLLFFKRIERETKLYKGEAGGKSVEEQHMAVKGAQLEVAFPSEHDVRAADSLPSPSLFF